MPRKAKQSPDPRHQIGTALWGCLATIQSLMLCARSKDSVWVSWEQTAEDTYKGQKAREAIDDRPATGAVSGLQQWGERLHELQRAHPEAARYWSCLSAWVVVCEVLDIFRRAGEEIGTDRAWAQHWLLVRPGLANYRCSDEELEAMIVGIQRDLKSPSPPLFVPALIGQAAPDPAGPPPDATAPPPGEPLEIVLLPEHVAILEALEHARTALTPWQIARELSDMHQQQRSAGRTAPVLAIGQRSIENHLKALLGAGLVARPHGTQRKGVAITKKGRQHLPART
jgi:DNA-binding transcriptional ArsR family regulator